MVLQTFGGILLLLIGYNTKQIVDRVDGHDREFKQTNDKINTNADRTTKLEVKNEGVESFVREIRQDIKEIKDELKRKP